MSKELKFRNGNWQRKIKKLRENKRSGGNKKHVLRKCGKTDSKQFGRAMTSKQ